MKKNMGTGYFRSKSIVKDSTTDCLIKDDNKNNKEKTIKDINYKNDKEK